MVRIGEWVRGGGADLCVVFWVGRGRGEGSADV